MSLVMRIYLSMAAMIVLILGVGGFASFKTNELAHVFQDYRNMAAANSAAASAEEKLLEARIAALQFRAEEDPAKLTVFSSKISEVLDIKKEIVAQLDDPQAVDSLEQMSISLKEFEGIMTQAAQLQTERNDLVDVTTQMGRKARQQLGEVIETALADNDPTASSVAGIAANHLLLARLYLERYLVGNKPEDAERSRDEIAQARTDLDRLLGELQNPKRRELAQAAISDLGSFEQASLVVVQAITARNEKYQQMDIIGPAAMAQAKGILAAISDRRVALGIASAAIAKSSILAVSVIVIAGAVLGAILAFSTGRSVSKPIGKITTVMGRLAQGDLDIDIRHSSETHEIGKMTNAMVVFLENARSARDLDKEVKAKEAQEQANKEAAREKADAQAREKQAEEARMLEIERARLATLETFQHDMERILGAAAEGNFAGRMPESMEDASLSALAQVINRLLGATETNLGEMVLAIGELSNGNLGVRIEGDRQGAFLKMQEDFNTALARLSSTMLKIMQNGQNVSSTAGELQDSSLGMAKRAEDNATAVQETSTAIEEITASIKQVVTNAKAADAATRRVRESADHTKQVSNKTEESITAMTDASEQINRVVKVIEDIAFQINLLALNAGVEAARAGEAGRGFSVVASEVRALAQRSQEAVQEISGVIARNNQSVEAGVEQVGLSRKALEGIISEIEVASSQITEIATAVEQQSQGIQEVNTSVRAIDTTAQTNAAALEEMTACSVSLSEETNALAKELRQFYGVEIETRKATPSKVVTLSRPTPALAPKPAAEASKQAVNASPIPQSPLDDGWDEF